MKTFFLVLLLILGNKAVSQENYNSESYIVTLGDVESHSYIKDSTANAVVIYEEGKSYVHKNKYDLRTEEKHKIKILNRDGFDKATVTIYLYNDKSKAEYIEKIVATTYNKIGDEVVRTSLKEQDIYREKYNENLNVVKFTLPNVKEGCVITYSYTTISPFMFKYHGWNFQEDIPKLFSQYKASIPGNWLYHTKLVGEKKLAINDSEIEKNCLKMSGGASADCGNSTYAMKDIPAFIEEDYMTASSNYLARIEYELKTFRGMDGTIKHYTKSWKDVDKEFKTDREIGRQLKKTISLENFLSSEIINEKDNLKKAQAIYQYIQNYYTWNGEYKIFKDVSIKNLLKNKSGNVSSINILLHNMLIEANIDAKPVLLSTRNNGFPTTIFPVISDFNYFIVQVEINNKKYLLDATDNFLSFGEIPFKCLNFKGRLLDFKNGSSWIDLKPNNLSNVFYKAELEIDKNGVISGIINSKRTGYHALNYKRKFIQKENEYIEHLNNNNPYLEISNFKATHDNSINPDFKESYAITLNSDSNTDNIYLDPFFIKFFKENPFKLQQRSYPIDFGYKEMYYYTFSLKLNENYTIEETPKDLKLMLPNKTGQLLFSSNKIGNTLNIMLKIDFKKAIYEPEYYPYLKSFMGKIVGIQKNSLILLKKK